MRWTTVATPSMVWPAGARPVRVANDRAPEPARDVARAADLRPSGQLDTDDPRRGLVDRAARDDAWRAPLRPWHVDRI